MNVLNAERQIAARRRLRDLAETFPFGGTGELRGELLDDAVRIELDKLPLVEAEVWLSVHGYALCMALKYPAKRP
ncbi:hypothetical protein [Flindersiella endophytica]